MPVTVKQRDGGIEINGYMFSEAEAKKINTRIQNDDFTGDWSHVSNGLAVRKDGNTFILSKPDIWPQESWSFREWVEKSHEWKDYAQGTQDEWDDEFSTI
jgi:hypothetical protein